MGGGLMQLVAYGAQDVYLSGNPQITFFKVVYRRHTNFAVEPIQQTWNGAADFGRTVTCNVNRNGDLITNMYVVTVLNEVTPIVPWGYVSRLGHAMIENIKIEIGGSKIDEQYGDWLNIWYELTHNVGQERGYANMIGNTENLTQVTTDTKRGFTMYTPLQFWFNRNNGLALPLIALQYHDVRMTLVYRNARDCVNWGSVTPTADLNGLMGDAYLLIDYIYLDSEERKRFAQASHEYLIEQLQFTGSESLNSTNLKYRLNFNHPCKYLIWAPHLERYNSRTQWISYAFDDNWVAAKDRFAKIIFGACLVNTGDNNASSLAVTTGANGNIRFVTNGAAYSLGEVVPQVANSAVALGGILAATLAKVDVKFVAQGGTTPTTAFIALGATNDALAQSFLDNALVLKNDLTIEDMSLSLAQLQSGLTTNANPQVIAFLNLFQQNVVDYFNYGNFLNGNDNPVVTGKLQLNGHDRFQTLDGAYFNYVQPYQHFNNTPSDGVNVYSFALKAAEHQPSGTCNFSRIDNATLNLTMGKYNAAGDNQYNSTYIGNNSNSLLNIYTMNYNVLRVMSGMAGTAYSN